jgi:aspartate aminotransferase-like enzyme
MTPPPFGTFFLPGPTEVRREVLEAMLQPMIAHRGRAFESLFERLQEQLRAIFRTTRPVYVASASATGLMEAAVRNAPPGPVLSLVNGAFSERFAHIARACGREVEVLAAPLGATVPPDAVEAARRARPRAAITVVHSETSTGAATALPPLAALARAHGAMLLVDSVTGLGGMPVETDAWGLDFVLTGSQKALALPPGLAFAVASERYRARMQEGEARGLYFDLVEYEQFVHRHQTPNTPAIPLLYAADVQGAAIGREGIEARWARHAAMATHAHAWVAELAASTGRPFGVLAAPGARSHTVTAVTLPEGLAADAVVRAVAERGFVIGGGYGALKATTIRIGHMGDHTLDGLARCLDATRDAILACLP